MNSPPPIGAFRAIGLGARALGKNLRVLAFGLASEASVGLCRIALFAAGAAVGLQALVRVFSGDSRGTPHAWIPLLGVWLCVESLGALLRVLYLGAAVTGLSGALRHPRGPATRALASAAPVLGRALLACLLLWVIELAASLYEVAIAGAAALGVIHAFQTQAHGFAAILAGALGATLAAAVALVMGLYGRVFLVRAIGRGPSALIAAWEAWALLWRRFSTFFALVALGVGLLIAGGMISGAPGAVSAIFGPSHPLLALGPRLLGLLLSAGITACVELVVLGGFCAVDLDASGELPAPPAPRPAEPVLVAQEVLLAQAIEPDSNSGA